MISQISRKKASYERRGGIGSNLRYKYAIGLYHICLCIQGYYLKLHYTWEV